MSVHGYPAVIAFCCLFHVILGLCVDVSPSLRFFSVILPSAWCLSVVTDGHASSDWSPGPMLVDVRLGVICIVIGSFLVCFSSLCFYVFFLIRKGLFVSVFITTLVNDNEARREYEAEFGVPGISSSSAPPPMIFHLQLQNQIQRDCIRLPPRILSWEWFQDKLRTYCCL